MTEWPELIKKAQAEYSKTSSNQILEEIVRAQYGLIAFYIGGNKDDKALAVIDDAWKYLDLLKEAHPDEGWVYALTATFHSFKLMINPYRFFMKGITILNTIEQSEKLSPNDPDVRFFKANQTFYLPGYLGGNQKKGLDLYEALKNDLIQHPIREEHNWFHLLYLTSYGIACTHAKQYKNALEVYDTVLAIEPDYDWVRNELIPQAENHVDNHYLETRKKKLEEKM